MVIEMCRANSYQVFISRSGRGRSAYWVMRIGATLENRTDHGSVAWQSRAKGSSLPPLGRATAVSEGLDWGSRISAKKSPHELYWRHARVRTRKGEWILGYCGSI